MPSELVSPSATIGKNVTIGAHTRVHPNVTIGDNTTIGDFCIIGHPAGGPYKGSPLIIGDESIIRSHSVIYEGSQFGPQLRVGHSSLIREGIQAGVNLQIGSYNDLEGDATIGDWVRFHSNVHVGRGAKIGDLVWIFPYVVLTNDPLPPSGLKEGVELGIGSVICTSSVLLPSTKVGRGAFIAAMTRAKGEIPNAALVVGNDGKIVGSIAKLKHKASGKQHPWMNHFSEYYPNEAHHRIRELLKLVERDIELLDLKPQLNEKGVAS